MTVQYTGWLYDPNQPNNKGSLFDTSVNREPYSFVLGAGAVIPGWDQGLVGLKVGGVRQLVIPPDLAYGAAGRGPIPPNATLLFEVELLAVADHEGPPHASARAPRRVVTPRSRLAYRPTVTGRRPRG